MVAEPCDKEAMTRILVVRTLLLLGTVSQCHDTATVVAQQATPRPNILLIQADDLGYGDLSAYGQALFATPALDQLAREGIRFTHYYAGRTVCAHRHELPF